MQRRSVSSLILDGVEGERSGEGGHNLLVVKWVIRLSFVSVIHAVRTFEFSNFRLLFLLVAAVPRNLCLPEAVVGA